MEITFALELQTPRDECYCRESCRGSSVVEQPIRNRQVASSTLALGSTFLFLNQ
jgi:hypothetical protein